MTQLTSYDVFIATPGGLHVERMTFRSTLSNFNESHGYGRQVQFRPVGGEDTLGTIGRPQENINEHIRKCDYFFMILHDWWGSNPCAEGEGPFTSGTEEEFHTAVECLASDDYPLKQIVILFKAVPESQLADPGAQLMKVLAFKREREKKKDFMYKTFDTKDALVRILDSYLASWVREHEAPRLGPLHLKLETVVASVNTYFKEASYGWLKPRYITDNWEVALDEADKMFKAGRIVEAESIYSQASRFSSNPMHTARYAKCLRKLYRLFQAEEMLKKCIEISDKSNDLVCRAYALRQLGRVYEFRGTFEKALDKFEEAIEVYNKLDDKRGLAQTYMDMGFALSRSYKPEQAIENIWKAINLFEKASDFIGKGESFGYLGFIHKEKGDFYRAEEYYHLALSFLERDKGANGGIIAIVKSNMGVIYRIRGNVKEAEVLHTQALTFFNESYDLWARAREHCNLGLIYKINKEWEKALIMFNSALELEDQTMNERGKSIQLSNIGQIMMETGKYDRAEVYFNDSMEISKKLNDAKGQSYQYKNLARLYNLTERKDRAIEYISKSKQIDEQGKNQFEVAKCLEIMGEILQTEKGRILEAKKYFEEAKSIFVQLKMMNYADKVELGLENLRLLVA